MWKIAEAKKSKAFGFKSVARNKAFGVISGRSNLISSDDVIQSLKAR